MLSTVQNAHAMLFNCLERRCYASQLFTTVPKRARGAWVVIDTSIHAEDPGVYMDIVALVDAFELVSIT